MMTFMTFHWALVIYGVLALVNVDGSMAFRFPSKTKKPSLVGDYSEDIIDQDLSVLVRPFPADQSGLYSQALQLLSSVQASPSCNRLATSTLLNSCQTIEESTRDIEASLDDIRSIYAARLAMCEISSTGLTIPHECKLLRTVNEPLESRGSRVSPSEGNLRFGIHGNIGKRELSQCLQSLESRPQWWTSYSNNRQNAVVMCQAARVDIEKDELIKLHKHMVETSSDVDSTLAMALKDVNDGLSKQREFAITLKVFQKQLLQDLEVSNSQVQSYFAKVVNSMDTATQSVLSKITSVVDHAESDVIDLRKNIQKSSTEAMNLEKNIGKIFQKVVQDNSELAASQTRQWDSSRQLATELQDSLESMRSTEVHALLNAFGSIHNQLHASNELIALMHFRQNAFDERLLNLDKSFAGLETKAESFHTLQALQADAQTRLHNQINQIQTDMHITRRLLAEVTASASGLQTAIEDTSSKIAHMASFGGITAVILRWGWLLLAVFVIHQFNPQYASYATASLVFIFLVNSSGIPSLFQRIPADTVLIHYASGTRVPLLPLLKAAILLLLVLFIALLYRSTGRFPSLKYHTGGLTSSLTFPKLDAASRPTHRTWNI